MKFIRIDFLCMAAATAIRMRLIKRERERGVKWERSSNPFIAHRISAEEDDDDNLWPGLYVCSMGCRRRREWDRQQTRKRNGTTGNKSK